MAKENKVSVAEYHAKLKDMKIRFPKADEASGVPDYAEIIKEQAEILGLKSANEYILRLIEADIQNNPDGLVKKDFVFKSIREINNLKES